MEVTLDSLSSLVEDRDLNYVKKYGIEGVAKSVGVDINKGISDSDNLEARKAKFGVNKIPPREAEGFFSLFFDALQDKTLMILMASALFSIILSVFVERDSHGWIEGTAIIVAVLVVASVTAGNDYSKEKQFRKLSEVSDDLEIKVIRNGNSTVVSTFDILVGDIVLLETGDKICADGIIISSDDLKVDESSMTGESDTVKKNPENNPWMLSGCQVMEGRGKMLVVAVGPNSQWGKIKALVNKSSEETPLQQHLEELAETIGKIGLVAAILTFISLLVQWFAKHQLSEDLLTAHSFGEVVSFLITAITIVVVAVPEGLPLAVTLSLAYSMFKMMKDNNLVRHLEACETMGGATNICSDKTGTLTENRMTVVTTWIGNSLVDSTSTVAPGLLTLLTEGASVNSTAYVVGNNVIGSKTEGALIEFVNSLGFDYSEIRKNIPVLKMFPFSSTKKSMSTVLPRSERTRKFRVWTKGAPEIILERCSLAHVEGGRIVGAATIRDAALNVINSFATQGLRTIALAYQDCDSLDLESVPESNFTLVCICGIKDPVRKEVPDAVRQCQKAGITVRMLTGDNLLTATHIAKECGILDESGVAMEGPDFRKLSQTEFDNILPKLQVLARCSPQDKYRLVKRLRELGEVVAVTGDGTNDAPQLKEADVGFAMGISGTEVAKDASDIILLDDNFKSIVKAVLWGRNVYDSIRKFIQFQVTVNIVAVIIAFIGAVSHGESPLKPVQMLWVNLIMDTMAALALATEAPTADLLERKPYGRFENIITPSMWRNIAGQVFFQIIILFTLLYGAQNISILGLPIHRSLWTELDSDTHTTIVFNTFVFCQLFNEINSRKLTNELNVFSGIFTNKLFLGIMAFTVSVQYLIVQYGGVFTATIPLNTEQWLFCICVGFLSLPLGVLLRMVNVSSGRTQVAEEMPANQHEVRQVKHTNMTFREAGNTVMAANSVVRGLRHRRMSIPSM